MIKELEKELIIDVQEEIIRVVNFIKIKCVEGNYPGAIVGLSGGIDSGLCAALNVQALGKENVVGVIMPSQDSAAADASDAYKLAEYLGIQTIYHPTPIHFQFFQ